MNTASFDDTPSFSVDLSNSSEAAGELRDIELDDTSEKAEADTNSVKNKENKNPTDTVEVANTTSSVVDSKEHSTVGHKYVAESLDAVPKEKQTWRWYTYAAIWAALSISVPTYMLGSALLNTGMNWWETLITIFIANVIVLIPLILNAAPGTTYGIPFPVFSRASFGTRGAVIAALIRGLVGVGWFAFMIWLGGQCLYHGSVAIFPALGNSPHLGSFIGLNLWQLICVLTFLLMNVLLAILGIESIKVLEVIAAPLLLMFGVGLLIWAVTTVGWSRTLEATHKLSAKYHGDRPTPSFLISFWPHLTAIIGGWSTMILNILDFTRYSRSQYDQAFGQILGLPVVVTAFAFVGIAATGATYELHGKVIWNPVDLFANFSNPFVVLILCSVLAFAILAGNLTANLVSAANDFVNVHPSKISFRMAVVITGVSGILLFPWKLFSSAEGFVFVWLIGCSSILGTLAGVLLADYFIIKKQLLDVEDLYTLTSSSRYYYTLGINPCAVVACLIAMIPSIPGFTLALGIISATQKNALPFWIWAIYDYAWFVSVAIAFVAYIIMMWIVNACANRYKQFKQRRNGRVTLEDEVAVDESDEHVCDLEMQTRYSKKTEPQTNSPSNITLNC